MVDLRKYVGDEGIVIDENFRFRGEKKSIDSLISEMTNDGLFIDYVNTTGELVRVPVKSGVGVRPDKHGESGLVGMSLTKQAIIRTAYGVTGEQAYRVSGLRLIPNQLSDTQRQVLKTKLDEAIRQGEEHKKRRQDEVAEEVRERFEKCNDCVEHPYLSAKNIVNNYGLKELNGSLIIPVAHSITGQLRSLQYIDKKRR